MFKDGYWTSPAGGEQRFVRYEAPEAALRAAVTRATAASTRGNWWAMTETTRGRTLFRRALPID